MECHLSFPCFTEISIQSEVSALFRPTVFSQQTTLHYFAWCEFYVNLKNIHSNVHMTLFFLSLSIMKKYMYNFTLKIKVIIPTQ